MNDAEDMQIILQATLERQAACYEAALRALAELAAVRGRGEAAGDRLQHIFAPLNEVAEHEAPIAHVKRHWQQIGRPAGPALRAAIERVAALIRQLSRELHTIEDMARLRRDELAAELDGYNRRCQMQRAYLRKS